MMGATGRSAPAIFATGIVLTAKEEMNALFASGPISPKRPTASIIILFSQARAITVTVVPVQTIFEVLAVLFPIFLHLIMATLLVLFSIEVTIIRLYED